MTYRLLLPLALLIGMLAGPYSYSQTFDQKKRKQSAPSPTSQKLEVKSQRVFGTQPPPSSPTFSLKSIPGTPSQGPSNSLHWDAPSCCPDKR